MAGGIGMPNLGQMKSEIAGLEGKKSAVEGQRESIRNAISELKSKKRDIDRGIDEIRSKLGQEMPLQVKAQLTERLSMLKNARKNISNQLSNLSEKLGMMAEALTGLNSGIRMRKSMLERVAGQVTRMPMYNRELGKKKG